MGKCIIMDKRKIANQLVKDRLFSALVDFAGEKDWSKVKVTELIENPVLPGLLSTGTLNRRKKLSAMESIN